MKLIDYKRLGSDKGIPYSRDHLRRKVKAREFPQPIAISSSRIAWVEADIDAWLAEKAAARNGQAPAGIAPQPGRGEPDEPAPSPKRRQNRFRGRAP